MEKKHNDEQLNIEKVREQNRIRQANYRKRKKQAATVKPSSNKRPTSLSQIVERINSVALQYASQIGSEQFLNLFSRMGSGYENYPQIQNLRIKAISSLPADYTKEDVGSFLRTPYEHEMELRKTAEILRWSAYPFFKIEKSYQDILTYHYYNIPKYLLSEETKEKEFLREAILVEKLCKTFSLRAMAHKIVGQTASLGKVFYILRMKLDKAHNQVDYAFMQQLPQDWCEIIGYNNVSGYTISFNMMYFMQPGTDITQYGDLFLPYMEDFERVVKNPRNKSSKYVYASKSKINYYPDELNKKGAGQPRIFEQNGKFMYYVSLPIDKVWTFEIDDVTPAVATPFAGLLLTYGQQGDYEAAQLSLLLNPLIKIFTGEIPYVNTDNVAEDDAVRLSESARMLYEAYFYNLMRTNNTSGVALYSAPFSNIKSHDFTESVNANKISSSFNRYGMEKAGLSGLIPVSDDVKAGQAELSSKLESRFAETIYEQFQRMMNYVYKTLNLKYEWQFNMFGSIYTDDNIRTNAEKDLANGDLSAYFILSALNNTSWLDKITMMKMIKNQNFVELLTPPATSYTKSASQTADNPSGGRPQSEKITDSKEKSEDSGQVEE